MLSPLKLSGIQAPPTNTASGSSRGVRELVHRGQSCGRGKCGRGIGFDDAAYEAAGRRSLRAREVFAIAELIVRSRSTAEEMALLRRADSVHLSAFAADRVLAQGLIDRVSSDRVTKPSRRARGLPLLAR